MKKSDIPKLFRWQDLFGLSVLCIGLALATNNSEQMANQRESQMQLANSQGRPFLLNLLPAPFNQSRENFVDQTKARKAHRLSRKAERLRKISRLKNP